MIKSIAEIEDKQAIERRAWEAQRETGIIMSGIDPVTDPALFTAVLGIRLEWLLCSEEPMIANPQTS